MRNFDSCGRPDFGDKLALKGLTSGIVHELIQAGYIKPEYHEEVTDLAALRVLQLLEQAKEDEKQSRIEGLRAEIKELETLG